MTEEARSIVVGGGIIGLAVARELALAGRDPLILEAEDRFGMGISSRNSEVIHAGLYYPGDWLKTRLCIAGRERLYAYCAAHGIGHRRIGKLVTAQAAGQLDQLAALHAHGLACGVDDLILLDRREAIALEPELACQSALYSPSTGIVDSHGLMLALLGEAEAHGARFVPRSRVERIASHGGLWRIRLAADEAPAVAAPVVVNAAGLFAQALAHATEGLATRHVPPLYFARGRYFAYTGKIPFSRLIYPLPEPGGLGTHLTFDLAGNARFGPDVDWIDAMDYSVDPGAQEKFASAARRVWPNLDPGLLVPAYAGIRPKLSGPGEPPADFVIGTPAEHGCPGLVNLFGIESPGLTAALAIAGMVRDAVA